MVVVLEVVWLAAAFLLWGMAKKGGPRPHLAPRPKARAPRGRVWGRYAGPGGVGFRGSVNVPYQHGDGTMNGTMPPIIAYEPEQGELAPYHNGSVEEKKVWLLPSMVNVVEPARGVGGGKAMWKCVEGMSVVDVQAQVFGLLESITTHILDPLCLTLGGVPQAGALLNYLVSIGVGEVTNECMPGKAKGKKGVFMISNGYYSIYMGQKVDEFGKRRTQWEYAHRTVCFAFHGPPLPKHEVGHLCGEVGHLCGCANCLSPKHLAWVTHSENGKMREWHKQAGLKGKVCPESYYRPLP